MLATAPRIPRLAARFGAVPVIVGAVVVGSADHRGLHADRRSCGVVRPELLHGVVGGVPWVVSEIWMNVVVEEKRRGRVMGVYATLVALGMALGPLVLQVVGVYGPVPFLTCAASPCWWRCRCCPIGRRAPAIEHAADSGFAAVVVVAPLAMLAAFACGLGEQVAFSFLPVYAVGAGVSARDRRAVAVGFRDRQRRAAMADRLDGRSRRPPRRAGRLHAGQRRAGRSLLPLVPAQSPAIIGVVHAVGRHFLRDLSGRPGAARPALPAAATSPAPTPPSACSTSWAA